MEVRTDALDTSQRRLLILVDGTPTVNDLGAYVRVGDLDGALAYLFQTLDAQTAQAVARQFDAMLL